MVTDTSPGVSPPQPDRQRIATRAAENMPPEILDLILSLIIREAWLIGLQGLYCNLHSPDQKVNKTEGYDECENLGRRR